MPITFVTGTPGAGKSYYAVRRIKAALERGQVVATNVALHDGWATAIARSNPFTRLVPGRVRKKAARYEQRLIVSDDLDELFRVRLHGDGESRGVMVLDEAHNWMNGRSWDVDETGGTERNARSVAVNRRMTVVKFFTQHRKLGWEVVLITQAAENLDAQVRRLCEFNTRLRNLRQFKVAGITLFPFNLFIAIKVWNDPSKSIMSREVFRLHRRTARLYDTMALSHGLEDDASDAIWMPRPPQSAGGRPVEDVVRGRPYAPLTMAAAPAGDEAGASPVPQARKPASETHPPSSHKTSHGPYLPPPRSPSVAVPASKTSDGPGRV
jgi:zona occludens toxin (predicted ATPase)